MPLLRLLKLYMMDSPLHSHAPLSWFLVVNQTKTKSTKPGDKRKLSLLNSDFKSVTGITNDRLKQVATHTLSPCQLAIGDDRRIHHGINQARDAIMAAGQGKEGVGILDNDYQAAFNLGISGTQGQGRVWGGLQAPVPPLQQLFLNCSCEQCPWEKIRE